MGKKVVHVVGTGTIGEPLIGLLCTMREELGLDEITFHKKSALLEDRSKVKGVISMGAKLAADDQAWTAFNELGISPTLSVSAALEQAAVIIDCTPVGNENKTSIYAGLADGQKGFIAQGSEFGFGKPYARGINDDALTPDDKFIQVVSCNTHNLSVLIHTLGMNNGQKPGNLEEGRFVCMRRANDISQDGSYIPSPQAGKHADERFGTHHARDAWHVFDTLGYDLDLFSSAIKLNTQYMHAIWFQLKVKDPVTLDSLKNHINENPRVAVTYKKSANSVFSFGRDHGHYGRILSQTVLPVRSLVVNQGREIMGFCYTPQDGNALLSSVAATMHFLYPEEVDRRLRCLRPFMFQEV